MFDTDPAWREYYLAGVPEFYRGSWSWDGMPYSVVHDANCMMTWWRTDVFADLGLPEPTTFEIILANAKKLNEKKPNSGYMTCAARNAWFLGMTYTGMMHGFGGKWYDERRARANSAASTRTRAPASCFSIRLRTSRR